MNFQSLFILGILAFGAYQMIQNSVRNAKEFVRDTAADTVAGELLGIRSTAGSKAAKWIKDCLWLRYDYRDWLLTTLRVTDYDIRLMSEYLAEDIAMNIIASNTVIFGNGVPDRVIDWLSGAIDMNIDHPTIVVENLNKIQNQAQAMQVQWYYYQQVKKNLSAGLQWLPDEWIIPSYQILSNLPTGIRKKGAKKDLPSLPIPPNIK